MNVTDLEILMGVSSMLFEAYLFRKQNLSFDISWYAARSCRLRAAFSSPRSQFFTTLIQTDPKLANLLYTFIFSCDKFACKWVYTTLSLNWPGLRVPCTNHHKKDVRKMYFKKNRFISNYFMIVASSSLVKFSKIVFLVWNFVQSLKLHNRNSLSVIANRSKSDFLL